MHLVTRICAPQSTEVEKIHLHEVLMKYSADAKHSSFVLMLAYCYTYLPSAQRG